MACFGCRKLFSLILRVPRSATAKMNKITQKSSSASAKISSATNSNTPNLSSAVKAAQKFEVLPTPVKSASDKKEYRVIRLENGLTACLISDSSAAPALDEEEEVEEEEDFDEEMTDSEMESENEGQESGNSVEEEDDSMPKKMHTEEQKMAAAGLCVGVGSFSDPKNIPGMAHFLEHMVFMGSEKFPEENDFDSFIKNGGGSDNASTDCETTSFYFECLEKHLYKGLDKFAQFFIAPLMKKESMTREREAVDSEFQMALPSDTYRKEQLLASLCRSDAPANTFTWGNLATLKENVSDTTLYQSLHEFRKRHYSAHRMTVAIQARLPMEVLEAYVLECFSKVPSNQLPADDFKRFAEGIYDTAEFKRVYYVKPVKDVCQVDLTWALPSLLHMYRSKPHQYVSWLLGHEGKGSLLSYLRQKVWVLGIYTGNGESGCEHNSMFTLFTISLILTEEGIKHLTEVIEAVFGYISLLKQVGPQERIFREIQKIEDTSFRFADEESAVDLVEELAEAMQYYPPDDYLTGSELYFEYDPRAIEMVVDHLVPQSMNIMIFDTNLPAGLSYDKVEPWFKTPFIDKEIPPESIARWQSAVTLPEFQLPEPNIYLTTEFSLLPSVENHPEYPEKFLTTPQVEVWYRKDQKFNLPMGYYYFYFISPKSIESPLSAALLDIFVSMLTIQLSEEAYPALLAELSYSVTVKDRGILLKIEGYNEKLPVLIELVTEYFKNVHRNLNEKLFNAVKAKLAKGYYNKFLKPSTLAKDVRIGLLVNNFWSPFDRYDAAMDVTYKQMEVFSQEIIKQFYLKVLVQGNVDKKIALGVVQKMVDTLKFEPLPPAFYPKFRIVQLPQGENCVRIWSFNKNDANSIITNYYQSGAFTVKDSVIIELLMMIINEPLFDHLRTKEQLGYNVFSTLRDTFGVLGYSITVNTQANKNTTEHVDARIEAFIKHVRKLLNRMSAKKMDALKNDLIKLKRCGDVVLSDEVGRNWGEISSDQYLFDRHAQEIKWIGEVKVQELRRWWEEHNRFEKSASFRKLSVQVVGYDAAAAGGKEGAKEKQHKEVPCPHSRFCLQYAEPPNSSKNKNAYYITDVQNFKQNLNLYPVTDKK